MSTTEQSGDQQYQFHLDARKLETFDKIEKYGLVVAHRPKHLQKAGKEWACQNDTYGLLAERPTIHEAVDKVCEWIDAGRKE